MQIVAMAGAAGGLYHIGLLGGKERGQVVRFSRSMMGTEINLILQAAQTTLERMETLERSAGTG